MSSMRIPNWRSWMGLCLALTVASASAQTTTTDKLHENEKPADKQPATQPAAPEANAPVRTPSQPSAADILEEFRKQRPANRPILPAGEPGETVVRPEPGDAPATEHPLLPESTYLTNRAGRLTREGDWWTLSFEAENPAAAPEPPMKLHRNRLLEHMIRESESTAGTPVFIVSGEITEFMGENYLLMRKVLRRRDMGNLQK